MTYYMPNSYKATYKILIVDGEIAYAIRDEETPVMSCMFYSEHIDKLRNYSVVSLLEVLLKAKKERWRKLVPSIAETCEKCNADKSRSQCRMPRFAERGQALYDGIIEEINK
jgi:hypothetical protein